MSYTVSQRVPHGTERQVPPVVTHSSLDWPPSCPAGQLFTVPLPVNLNSWKRTVVWKRWWRWDTSLNSRTDAPGAEGLISAPDAFPEPRTQLGGNPPYPLPPCQRSHLTSLTAASLSSKSLPREKKKKCVSICHHSPLRWEMKSVASLKEKWQDSEWCSAPRFGRWEPDSFRDTEGKACLPGQCFF